MSVRRIALALLGCFIVSLFLTLHLWPYREAVSQYLEAADTLERVDQTNEFDLGLVEVATYILWQRAEHEYNSLTSLDRLVIPHQRQNFQDPRRTDFPELAHYTDDQILAMYQTLRGKLPNHRYFLQRPGNRNLQNRVL